MFKVATNLRRVSTVTFVVSTVEFCTAAKYGYDAVWSLGRVRVGVEVGVAFESSTSAPALASDVMPWFF
jgi:hypothetical protein